MVYWTHRLYSLHRLPQIQSWSISFHLQSQNILSYLLVYVDNFVLTGNNASFLDQFVLNLANMFSIIDLGTLHHFLGFEVIHTSTSLFLSQRHHIQDLLTQSHMDGEKEVTTPLNPSINLKFQDATVGVDPTPYRKLVCSLQYLAFIRPDISFGVNKLSQFMYAPSETHWKSLKMVLRYLKGTSHHGLFLSPNLSMDLTAFLDSDWGGIEHGFHSTTAYLVYLGSNIISWWSACQKSGSRSSTEVG